MGSNSIQAMLDDEALVVRGGLMKLVTTRISVDTCLARRGYYGLSFFGDNDLSLDEIVDLGPIEHAMVRVSTAGRVRQAGYEPERTGTYPHLTVRFDISPTDDELVELAAAFDSAIPNPGLAD